MDGVAAGDAHSVSAVAVIDLGDRSAGRSHGGGYGHGSHDPHGLLSSHSVVVIGGEEHVRDALLSPGHTPDDDDDEDEEDDDDDDDGGGCGCGEDCGHDDDAPATVHMIHMRTGHAHGDHGDGHSPTPSSNASTSGKRKRVVLSIHEKQQVLQRLEMGEQPVVISREFGISRQQVSDIKKNKDRILAYCIDAKHLSSLRRKTLKSTTEYHPAVEQELYRWLIRQRKLGRGVTPDALAHKTTDLFMQYASEDAAHVAFRSVNVWLRHFKRAHNIKALDEDELARLPTMFTPAMDMTSGSQSGTDTADGSAAGVTTRAGGADATALEGSNAGRASPTPTTSTMLNHDVVPSVASLPLPPVAPAVTVAATDDVSSYMTNMELAHATPPHQSFLLQNHAPAMDVHASHPYQMLMLSSASLTAATATLTATPAIALTPLSELTPAGSSPLHSCVHLAQRMHAQLSGFEHAMAVKLDTLDARVEKLCFSVLSTAGVAVATTTSSRFA